MKSLAIVAAAAAFQSPSSAVSPAPPVSPFCRDYLTVLDQAYRGFRPFRGASDEAQANGADRSYRALFSMPGASCRIDENDYTYRYVCSWPHRDAEDWDGAIAEAQRLGTALGACSHLRFDEAVGLSRPGERWLGLLAHQPGSRTKVEVSASRYSSDTKGGERRAYVRMSITYRRETGS